jgi:mannose-6-phosphate isomerase-like protein (cupin superfamily)
MTEAKTAPEVPVHRVRRVVTGHDARGHAVVISDGPAPFVHQTPSNVGWSSTDIWRTLATPAPVVAQAPEPTLGPRRQMPTPNGTVLRVNTFPPESEAIRNMDIQSARQTFASLGNEAAATFGHGGRHPMMHRTETIDYAIVLEGEIVMVLDDEDVTLRAGDIVVQCGTNHAWSNRSDKPCRVAFILIDGQFDPALAETLRNADA